MFQGYVTAGEKTDIYCLARCCTHDQNAARTITGRLSALPGILDTAGSVVRSALASDMSDYEDAVMAHTALRAKTDCIATRNPADLKPLRCPFILRMFF